MGKLGKLVFRYKKTTILLWIAIIAFFSIFALKLPSVLSGNGFEYDGEFKQTQKIIENDFGQSTTSILLLFEKEDSVKQTEFESFINDTLVETKSKISSIETIMSPLDQQEMKKDDVAYAVLLFPKETDMDMVIPKLRQALTNDDGLTVKMTGEPVIVKDINEASQSDLAKAEMIGLPIALVVLILAFGGLVAAGIPLIIGVISILTTMGVVYFFSYAFDLSIFILNIVPMIGLALSIDFALLFINRFKEEIQTKSIEEAISTTLSTAGRSIVFSGLCVFIGLLGLMFIQIDIFINVALGGMAVLFVSVLSAITFLPALLALLGKKINSLSLFKVKSSGSNLWRVFANIVMKRPIIMTLIALTILIIGLLPVKDINLAIPETDALPTSYESRTAMDTFEKHFVDEEKSDQNKVVFVLESSDKVLEQQSLEAVKKAIDEIKQDSLVTSIESPFSLLEMDEPMMLAQVALSQNTNPQVAAVLDHYTTNNKMMVNVYLDTTNKPEEARAWVKEWATKDFEGLTTYVGGMPKFEQEIFDEIFDKAPYGLALILLSTFFILMIAFRSVLIPLKAILMNVMSLGATFGIIVWIFQGGHFGMESVDIALILPVFVFSLVFGLSMDYEVFLISRIHETYQQTKNNEQSTLTGLISTSKIITSAAAIMIVVTGAFAFTDVTPVKQMGVGIALAIFIDATIVRMILVPALMKLLGDWNWWFPGMKKKELEKKTTVAS
ncbi:MMPL family transporter [Bacillus timonensis]|nr:MMPL family transporter [Bacillus timonensis]